jgi:hypothetical protein
MRQQEWDIRVPALLSQEKRGEPVQLQVDNLSNKHGGISISGFGRRFLVDKTGQDQVKSLA